MKEKSYSEAIANAIKAYLNKYNVRFSFDEEEGMFEFVICLRNKIKNISYVIDVKEKEYIAYAIAPIGADGKDEKMMANMAEFVCRVNYDLKMGSFELDMRNGEIRYKCFVDCGDIIPTDYIVRHSILCPAAMFESYGSGIIDIIYGNVTAKEAVEKCEKAT